MISKPFSLTLGVLLFVSASCATDTPVSKSAVTPPTTSGVVKVLLDPATVSIATPQPVALGSPARQLEFAPVSAKAIPRSSMHPMLAAGCDCASTGVEKGILRVRLHDGDIHVDAMCGHLWNPVYQTPSPNQDAQAAASLVRVATQVVTSGWPRRGTCRP